MWCVTKIVINNEEKPDYFTTPFTLGVNLKGLITLTNYETGESKLFDKVSAIKVYRPIGYAEIADERGYRVSCYKVISKFCYDFLAYIDCYTTAIRGKYTVTDYYLSSSSNNSFELKDDYIKLCFKGSWVKPVPSTNHVLWSLGFGSGRTILSIFDIYVLLCNSSESFIQMTKIPLLVGGSKRAVITVDKRCKVLYSKYRVLSKGRSIYDMWRFDYSNVQ